MPELISGLSRIVNLIEANELRPPMSNKFTDVTNVIYSTGLAALGYLVVRAWL